MHYKYQPGEVYSLFETLETHVVLKDNESGATMESPLCNKAVKKVEEMNAKLVGYYTNFF